MMMDIRKLTTITEMEAVYELERKIWQTEIVPTHQTITVVKNGGLMLGAYHGGKLIGFSYSFPGFANNKLYLCSHMLGIDPDFRSQGIGERLKWEQRHEARRLGYDLITWTFDPLETRNAYLNLTKLHGVSMTYIENCYGNLQDGLNHGLPTDRLEIAWHIGSAYVETGPVIDYHNVISINDIVMDKPVSIDVEWDEAAIYGLHVTNDFQSIKQHAAETARAWRLHTREKFQQLFSRGYVAFGLQRQPTSNQYVFIHRSKLQLTTRGEKNENNRSND